jgi:hypothetical protein
MKPPSLAVRRRCRLFCSSKIGESREQKIATEPKAKTRRNGDPIEKLLGRQQTMSSGGRRTQFLASRGTATSQYSEPETRDPEKQKESIIA